ncbi:MAG: Uma2 family endonuclease [Armatimonadetes bacterium]|nr:Uma2 family endonuclease [Armatimonadota bacterium]
MAETAAAKPKLTEEEFLRLPDDGRKYELVDGEAKEVPAGVEHDIIVVHIIVLLAPFVKNFGMPAASSAGFQIVTGNIRSPDVSFVLRERLPEDKPLKGFMDGAPDLAIEVVSPNEDWVEMGRKLGEYFMSGAKEVWLVDPDKVTVTVYKSLTDVQVFHADDEITGGDLLPNFRCKVADLVALEYGEKLSFGGETPSPTRRNSERSYG